MFPGPVTSLEAPREGEPLPSPSHKEERVIPQIPGRGSTRTWQEGGGNTNLFPACTKRSRCWGERPLMDPQHRGGLSQPTPPLTAPQGPRRKPWRPQYSAQLFAGGRGNLSLLCSQVGPQVGPEKASRPPRVTPHPRATHCTSSGP